MIVQMRRNQKRDHSSASVRLTSVSRSAREKARALRPRTRHDATMAGKAADHPMRVLLDNPIKLYRDCMRLADYLAHKQGFPRDTMRATVRAPWRKHQNETDTEEIMRHREAAVRGLSNYMTYEASKGAMEGVPAFEPEDAADSGNKR